MRCLNCDAALPGGPPFARFCHACGQQTALYRFALWPAVQRVARTLAQLFFRPGILTLEWIAGRRQRYVLPRPLLAASLLAVVVVVRLVPLPPWVDASLRTATTAARADGFARDLAPSVERLAQSQWPAADRVRLGIVHLGRGLVQRALEDGDAAFFQRVLRVFVNVLYYSSLVTFPLQAASLWIVFRGSGIPYRQHLVYAMHSSTAWALILCLAYLSPHPGLAAGLMVIAAVRGSIEIRRSYGDAYRPWRRKLALFLLMQCAVVPLQLLALWLVAFGPPA